MVCFLVLYTKKKFREVVLGNDGVRQESGHKQRYGMGSLGLEGVRGLNHLCLALTGTLCGLTPVTRPGDCADKSWAERGTSLGVLTFCVAKGKGNVSHGSFRL